MKPFVKLILISPIPLFFLFLLPWYIRRFDTNLPQFLPDDLRFLGILFFIPGLLVVSWVTYLFVTVGEGTPAPFAPTQKFVAIGPYKYVRNPMMLGVFAMILGQALWYSSTAVLILLLIGVIFAPIFVVFWEEPDLEDRFGETYLEYKKSVPRWIPKLPKR